MKLSILTLTVVGGVSPSETVQLWWAGFHQANLFNLKLTVVGVVSPSETVHLDTNCGGRGFTK